MKQCFGIILLLSTIQMHSQISDFFEDKNFLYPTWYGDTLDFTINSEDQLQLNAVDAGQSAIYIPYIRKDTTEASIYFHLDFAPSNNNQLYLYPFINTPNIEEASGYQIQIGESGSDDNIKLFKLEQGRKTQVGEGKMGVVATEPVRAVLQFLWIKNLFKVQLNTADHSETISISDNDTMLRRDGFFMIQCHYTKTRKDQFRFDNFYAGTPVPDTIPPRLNEILVEDSILVLSFTEKIDTQSIILNQIIVHPDIGNPIQGIWNEDSLRLKLIFAQSFHVNTTYQLILENITDLTGNKLAQTAHAFEQFEFQPLLVGDLIISEFLPDPTPSQGLPAEEFIELYNNSSNPIDLDGFQIIVNNRKTNIPRYILRSNEYVILTGTNNQDLWASYSKIIEIDEFPVMRNQDGEILLVSPSGRIIHQAIYDKALIQDTEKQDGGWTFEIINPNLICERTANWSMSISSQGGTPGQSNSVQDTNFEGTPFSLNALWANDTSIFFELSHLLLTITSEEALTLFQFKELQIDTIYFDNSLKYSGLIPIQLLENEIHEVRLNPALAPCSLWENNRIYRVGKGRRPETNELIVNEVLFNPKVGKQDYIEIVNNSEAILNIKDLWIKNQVNGQTAGPVDFRFSVMPGQFLCLSGNPAQILVDYPSAQPELIHYTRLPGLPNVGGNISLYFDEFHEMNIIDQMNYDENMHHPLIFEPDGVALEKVNFNAEALDPGSWHSASAQANFGTPTLMNSQHTETIPSEDFFKIPKRVLNLDLPDQNQELMIRYQLREAGFMANVGVFDLSGQKTRNLYHQYLLGTSGTLSWDGKGDNQEDLIPGVYIIYIEAFQPSGKVIRKKLSCVLARNL